MKHTLFGGGLVGALALTASVAAQDPQPRGQDQARMVTVEGCLMREADVPGRKPNVAERAGIAEDYILTSTKIVKGSPPETTAAQPRPGETATGTAGTRGAMYEVEGIDDERLKPHVGHLVQIDGTFENVDRGRATPERATPADDLIELRATGIRHVSPNCPAKQ